MLLALATCVGSRGLVCGLDLAAGMLAQSRSLCHRKAPAAPVFLAQADATALPFAAGAFDAVFMSFTLELFDTPEIPDVLAECRRVLTPSGRIQVVGLSREGEPGLAVAAYEWGHRHFPNLLDCRPILVAQALQAAGFTIRRRRRLSMWVPVEVVLGESPRPAGPDKKAQKKRK
jgi:demethylmenaquinone methyltransferase/2-methoxy-6-polyprenyl-1,4-benzoquinol methylase